jgi:hypothetical protein
MRRLQSAPKAFIAAIFFGIAAFWGVIELTEPPGPSLDPDALAYLGAGTSLAHGHGLRVPSSTWSSNDTTAPLVHFPPGFSATIAIGTRRGSSKRPPPRSPPHRSCSPQTPRPASSRRSSQSASPRLHLRS